MDSLQGDFTSWRFTSKLKPSTSTRHCSVRLSPIAENSPLLPPVGGLDFSVADHRLGKLLPHQLANQPLILSLWSSLNVIDPLLGRIPPFAPQLIHVKGISSRFQLLFPSQGQVLTRYSPVRHWKDEIWGSLHRFFLDRIHLSSHLIKTPPYSST
ncbi:leucine-rich receptor-like protein kinase family protein [Striga asiatica]|uniref:Leucine-rich receptor-like protein kinase family protein n=1 Tax=Striga asiatica TaxID=4170 RepID=A0A5A7QY61_STRAF|nr:leucine-rich receptor-like protein kinase family protein [Striga asiatica]